MHRSRPSRSLRPLLVAALTLSALALSACGSDDDGDTAATTTTTTAPAGGESYRESPAGSESNGESPAGTIVAADFSLSDLIVAPGAPIVLDNQDSATHTATADDGAFDLGRVDAGATSEPGTAPEEPGSYPFHCEIHRSMTATLTVEG